MNADPSGSTSTAWRNGTCCWSAGAEAEAAGDFTIEGERAAAHRQLGLFAPR